MVMTSGVAWKTAATTEISTSESDVTKAIEAVASARARQRNMGRHAARAKIS